MAVDKRKAIKSGRQFAALVRSKIDSDALVFLFGSFVKDKTHDRSDIDIAVVSKTFGDNVVDNLVSINLLGYSVHPDIEAHAISTIDWEYATPFISEIKKTGVAL